MKTKTAKQMRKEIKDKYESIPEGQVYPGVYIHTVGPKWVTLLNTWNTTSFDKEPLDDFYYQHVAS